MMWYATKANPFLIGGLFLRELMWKPKFLIHFVALIFMLFLNKFELKIENKMGGSTHDFAGFFQTYEGHFTFHLQQALENPVLTAVLSFIYVVMLQGLLVASVGIYTYEQNRRPMFYATCYAIMINYLASIPFYLFFPVNEVWFHDPTVRFLIPDVFPNFETQYRALSGINNCFPSLHTSISVTIALLAIRSGNKRWAWFSGTCAVLIMFATLYLGIHWLTDLGGGLLLALAAAEAGIRLSRLSVKLSARRSQALKAGINYAQEDIQ